MAPLVFSVNAHTCIIDSIFVWEARDCKSCTDHKNINNLMQHSTNSCLCFSTILNVLFFVHVCCFLSLAQLFLFPLECLSTLSFGPRFYLHAIDVFPEFSLEYISFVGILLQFVHICCHHCCHCTVVSFCCIYFFVYSMFHFWLLAEHFPGKIYRPWLRLFLLRTLKQRAQQSSRYNNKNRQKKSKQMK